MMGLLKSERSAMFCATASVNMYRQRKGDSIASFSGLPWFYPCSQRGKVASCDPGVRQQQNKQAFCVLRGKRENMIWHVLVTEEVECVWVGGRWGVKVLIWVHNEMPYIPQC